ncbi:MAG: hypothetical protein JW955_17915 [Sedimentisphaerales bacterium]|nr:hypothetical protein [Sedimentisphaerales bacterium]
MVMLSNDADILKCEPILFGELHLPSQVLASGTGAVLSGTTLTASGADFEQAGVCAGGVIHLQSAEGSLDGTYEIVSVDSASQLTVSVLRSDAMDAPIPPVDADDIAYRISTFGPQATDAAFQLTQYFGIQPGNPNSAVTLDDIVDTEGLRRASALLVVSAVYAMWSDRTRCEAFWRKSQLYKRLFEEARQRCHVSVDLGSDGTVDLTRIGGAIRLVRD